MALQLVTLCRSISELSVTSVTIMDLDVIPPNAQDIRLQVMYPEPDGFVSDFEMVRNSYGSSNAKMTVTYNLNYTYLHAPIGTGRTGLDAYTDMITYAMRIIDAILAIDTITGAIDITPTITQCGAVVDPSGNTYLGCRLALTCTEFVN